MADSSIHIADGASGYFAHNSRERETVNSIFNDEQNFCSCDTKTAFEVYRSELEKRTQAYCENKGRSKLHAKTVTHLSAIVNLNQHHTEADLKKLCDHLEKRYDTKVIQYSIHRDEGHINENGTALKNYHAHIEFMGLDSQGNSIKRQLKRKELIELQTDTAKILDMKRGTNYTAEQKPRPKRLDTYEYKNKAEALAKKTLANENDLKAEIAQLRAELKEAKAVREDYAKLDQLNKDLKEQIKSKDVTMDELRNSVEYWRDGYKRESKETENLNKRLSEALQSKKAPETIKDMPKEEKIDFRPLYAPKITYKTVEVKTGMFGSEKQEVLPKKEAIALEVYAEELEKQNKSLKRQNTELKSQVEVLEEFNGYQDAELKKLSSYKKAYNDLVIMLKAITKIDKVEEIINAIREKFSPFAKTQEAQTKREEKANTFQAIRAEADTHLKEQKPLKGKELMDEVQRLNEQGKKNMEYAKEQSKEPEKKKSHGHYRQ